MPFDPYVPDDDRARQHTYDVHVLRTALSNVRRPWAWCRGMINGPGDSHCAVGWVMHVADYYGVAWKRIVREHVVPVLPRRDRWRFFDEPEQRVYRYNDFHDQADIVALFERAVRRLERVSH